MPRGSLQQWDRFWKHDRFSGRHPSPPAYVRELVPVFRKEGVKRVLDLGCGSGRNAVYLAKKGFIVVGQDISSVGLELARRNLELAGTRNCVLVNHDVTRLPFPDGSIDAVVSVSAIHHNRLRDIKRAAAEIHRVLVPRGLFAANLAARKKEFVTGREIERGTYMTLSGIEKGVLHHIFTRSEIMDTFRGFKVVRLRQPTQEDTQWVLLARKA